jgi:glycosyltransferase involved in cell wall biosynthesis
MDGAEGIHIREMIKAFEALGHTVVTSGPGASGGDARASGWRGVLRRTLPQGGFELATAAYNIPEWYSGRRLLARTRPAFVYKRHALNDIGMLHAARAAGVPSVLEVNVLYSSMSLGAFEPLHFSRLARHNERKGLELADVVITVSSPLAELVRELAPNLRAMLVLPNGVDPRRFHPDISGSAVRTRFAIPADAVVVGWCGIMRSWHRLELLLEALGTTRHFLLLVGDGPARDSIERQARAMGLEERVKFAGRVAADDVPTYLAAIDIGVVADDLTGYASPMKLLEYMAMGKPVVAPDLPNIRDLVAHGSEAQLFTPGDACSLAAGFRELNDAHVRQALGSRGRDRVEHERNWLSNAKRILSAIDARRR